MGGRALLALLLAAAPSASAFSKTPGWSAIDPVLTPYWPNGTLRLELVPALAANCASSRVDTVLLGGSNGEWPSLTTEERVALLGAWVAALGALKRNGTAGVPKLMFHVGSTDVYTARALAAAAEATGGVDSILSVAPGVIFTPADLNTTVAQLAFIAAGAPATPFYYYHYPGIYVVRLAMADFVPAMAAAAPTFAGVKYIDALFADLAPAAAAAPGLDFFPQSGFILPSLPFGSNGSPVFTWQVSLARAVYTSWAAGDGPGAAAAQLAMLRLNGIMAAYGGTAAARAAYPVVYGADLGPIRPPQVDLTPPQVAALLAELRAGGFLPSGR